MLDPRLSAASDRFYEALTRLMNGEAAPMAGIWSRTESITAMHPLGERHVGWPEIERSWDQVATLASEGHVKISAQRWQIFGEVACETAVMLGQSRLAGREVTFENRVTNVYHLEGSEWKIVHHHADVSPAMIEVLETTDAARRE